MLWLIAFLIPHISVSSLPFLLLVLGSVPQWTGCHRMMAHGKKSCSTHPCAHSLGLALGMATYLHVRTDTRNVTCRSGFPHNSSEQTQGNIPVSTAPCLQAFLALALHTICPLKDGYTQLIQQERAAAWQTGLRPTSTELGQDRGQVGKRTAWPCPAASAVVSTWDVSWTGWSRWTCF